MRKAKLLKLYHCDLFIVGAIRLKVGSQNKADHKNRAKTTNGASATSKAYLPATKDVPHKKVASNKHSIDPIDLYS